MLFDVYDLTSQDNKNFTLLNECSENHFPLSPAPLLKNKQQQKSGKELTAGLEDSTPYAYCLGGAVTSATKF